MVVGVHARGGVPEASRSACQHERSSWSVSHASWSAARAWSTVPVPISARRTAAMAHAGAESKPQPVSMAAVAPAGSRSPRSSANAMHAEGRPASQARPSAAAASLGSLATPARSSSPCGAPSSAARAYNAGRSSKAEAVANARHARPSPAPHSGDSSPTAPWRSRGTLSPSSISIPSSVQPRASPTWHDVRNRSAPVALSAARVCQPMTRHAMPSPASHAGARAAPAASRSNGFIQALDSQARLCPASHRRSSSGPTWGSRRWSPSMRDARRTSSSHSVSMRSRVHWGMFEASKGSPPTRSEAGASRSAHAAISRAGPTWPARSPARSDSCRQSAWSRSARASPMSRATSRSRSQGGPSAAGTAAISSWSEALQSPGNADATDQSTVTVVLSVPTGRVST